MRQPTCGILLPPSHHTGKHYSVHSPSGSHHLTVGGARGGQGAWQLPPVPLPLPPSCPRWNVGCAEVP